MKVWRLLVMAFAAAAVSGCLESSITPRAPALDESSIRTLLVTADEARTAAFAGADVGLMRASFAESALAPIRFQLDGLRRRGERIEERGVTRRLVHWAAGAASAEGVLEVAGEERLTIGGVGQRGWTRYLRQWLATLRWSGARWLIVEASDLPPPQWWKS